MRLITSYNPKWLENGVAMAFLKYVNENPAWWLNEGIAFKYLDIRMDSRTGHMLIASGDGGEPKQWVVGWTYEDSDVPGFLRRQAG